MNTAQLKPERKPRKTTTIRAEDKPALSLPTASAIPAQQSTQRTTQKTRVVIKYDVGFGNSLTIRGNMTGLSWEKGVPLKNVKADEWVWETEHAFTSGEFKILINDRTYEHGANHQIRCGSLIQYTPRF